MQENISHLKISLIIKPVCEDFVIENGFDSTRGKISPLKEHLLLVITKGKENHRQQSGKIGL